MIYTVYIYAYDPPQAHCRASQSGSAARLASSLVSAKEVQWKQGVVIYEMLYTNSLYNTTPIHCTPLPLHTPVMNTHPPRHR